MGFYSYGCDISTWFCGRFFRDNIYNHPPFGFALFYLKGAAGDQVSTKDIYRGIVPFIALQLLALMIVMFFPGIVGLF